MTRSTELGSGRLTGWIARRTASLLAIGLISCLGSGCCMTGACGGGGLFQGGTGLAGGSCASGGCGASGCDDCGGGSEVVFPGSCGGCSSGSCGGPSGFLLPLLSTRLACGGGCGDVYWNEWISDPPECCESCNDRGCWVGADCGSCGEGCGMGPCVMLHGAWQSVTGLARGILAAPGAVLSGCGSGRCGGTGYSDGMGCGAGGCESPGCDRCAQVGAATGQYLTASPPPTMNRATDSEFFEGSGVASPRSPVQMTSAQTEVRYTRPPHRVVAKRLRR